MRWVKATERLPEFKGSRTHLIDDYTGNLCIKANGLHFVGSFNHSKNHFEVHGGAKWREENFEKFEIYWLDEFLDEVELKILTKSLAERCGLRTINKVTI